LRSVHIIEAERRKYPGDDRIIMVGQAPSKHGDPSKPLTGVAGRKLAFLSGVPPLEFYASTVRVNVFDNYMGSLREGDMFPHKAACERVSILQPLFEGRRVVFVGRAVAHAFKFEDDWLAWRLLGCDREDGPRYHFEAACIPHPSGRNRFWGDRENTAMAMRFMIEAVSRPSCVPKLRLLRNRARMIEEYRFKSEENLTKPTMTKKTAQEGSTDNGGSTGCVQGCECRDDSVSTVREVPRVKSGSGGQTEARGVPDDPGPAIEGGAPGGS